MNEADSLPTGAVVFVGEDTMSIRIETVLIGGHKYREETVQ